MTAEWPREFGAARFNQRIIWENRVDIGPSWLAMCYRGLKLERLLDLLWLADSNAFELQHV